MSSQLQITKEFDDSTWRITAVILPGGSLPVESWLFVNEGGELGDFYAVCTKDTLTRPIFVMGSTPSFGVQFVRHDEVSREFDNEEDADTFAADMKRRIEALDVELTNNFPTITTHDIPEIP